MTVVDLNARRAPPAFDPNPPRSVFADGVTWGLLHGAADVELALVRLRELRVERLGLDDAPDLARSFGLVVGRLAMIAGASLASPLVVLDTLRDLARSRKGAR